MVKIICVKTFIIQGLEMVLDQIYHIRYQDAFDSWEEATGRLAKIDEESLTLDTSKKYHNSSVKIQMKENRIELVEIFTK